MGIAGKIPSALLLTRDRRRVGSGAAAAPHPLQPQAEPGCANEI